jgi:hypothetical protein
LQEDAMPLRWISISPLALAALGHFALLGSLASPALGVEPAQAYLEGLRERGYYDEALEYLDAAQANPAVPTAFKHAILYERGATLVQGARELRDSVLREKQLDEGQKALQAFLDEQPSSILALATRSQLSAVIVERARGKLEKANKLPTAERQALAGEARALYGEAVTAFEELVKELAEKLKGYPAAMDARKDARRIEERDRLRTDHLQAQIYIATTYEEMAETVENTAKERAEMLTKAADIYKDIYNNYRTRLGGVYCHLYEGRCLLKLGRYKDASAVFGELLANPDKEEAFRTLKYKTMPLAVEAWFAQNLYLEIINKALPVIELARSSEDQTDEMMGMRLSVAKAMKAYAAELTKANPRDAAARNLQVEARKLVLYVTKTPSEYQETARKLLPEFAEGESIAAAQRPEPRNFAEASTAMKDTVEAMQAADLDLKNLPQRIQSESDQAAKAALQKQFEEAAKTVQESHGAALRYARLALRFASRETDVNDVNLVRYVLAYLLYAQGDLHQAATVGQFLAERYPEGPGARPCANIAMKSYLRLFDGSAPENRAFESARLISICSYITQKWPDQPEAEEALNTLIPFMIREKKLAEAQSYLERIPSDSPHRGIAELKTGQALWASYLENGRKIREWEELETPPAEVDLPARKRELEALKTKAKEILTSGVERMRAGGEAGTVLVTAILSLAQIYVDTAEPAKAVPLLEDPQLGLLTLVASQDSATQKPGFAEEVYKTALRAYISSLGSGADGASAVEKAKGVMKSLKEHVGDSREGQAQLVANYMSLAKDLQRQMEIADGPTKKSLGQGFEAFLSQVGENSTDLDILNWVGETYLGMAESYGKSLKSLTPEAKSYYQKSGETYQKILDLGAKIPSFLPPAMATQIRMQLAKTKRGVGDFVGAANEFEVVLRDNPALLPVQIEAARTYQEWGALGKPDLFANAIFGARPDKAGNGRNIIWGWFLIGNLTQGNASFKEQFYEARYSLVYCRYHYGMGQKDSAKKLEMIKLAKRDLTSFASGHSEMGGDRWRPQFDALLKNIQRELKEPPLGLKGLKVLEPVAAEPAASTAVPTSAPARGSPTVTKPKTKSTSSSATKRSPPAKKSAATSKSPTKK